ncbi:hypothetical protein SAMN05216360_12713 [Methylobacterium phyllostachyos]|uniref:Uncharacterized protein n=2 Tax=Methylobacterium phyllostachyos TaxID=582672 RepID=A0A1H0KHG8_9HYPH|nr:hypothetical protein SAMN05216360_12713 [Methylobacterium phyllostachyos]
MVAQCAIGYEESVAAEGCYEWRMDLSDLQFWAFLAVAIPGLFLPVIIVWWKGRPIIPITLLSLVFWPGALILALRLRRR